MKQGKENNEKKVKIKKEAKSGLAKFTQRPLPDENEVSDFENTIRKEIREEEINDNLSEIYQDKKGNLVDVNSKSFKKNKSWILIIFKNLLFLSVLAIGFYLIYYYYYQNQYLGIVEAKIEIEAPATMQAGEEFVYKINIHNPSTVALENLGLEIIFPSSFVITESSVEAEIANYWNLNRLLANETKTLEIKGKLYNRHNSANPIKLRLSYMPANFSSQFSKEASANTIIDGIGFDLVANYFNTALVGQDLDIDLSILNLANNYLDNLIIRIEAPDSFSLNNFDILKSEENDEEINLEELGVNRWRLSQLRDKEEQINFNLNFNVKEKINEEENIFIRLFHQDEENNERLILEENLKFDIMQSDLHLALEINDSRNDQSINFGDKLNYKLTYHNRGQASLNDLVLMLIIEGEMINWSSLEDENNGRLFENVLVYSKEEIRDLAELSPDEKGEINISLKIKDFQDNLFGSDLKIKSSAQFSFGLSNEGEIKRNDDNRSNLIEKQINSNLSIKEEIRYFDDNNIPVGSGPLPPEVGEESSVRVYWTLTNSLHELEDVRVVLELPSYVTWKNRLQSNIGQLSYDENNNQIIWQIDNLSLTNYRADAEFNISFTPKEDDRDKILILSPGLLVSAKDLVTGGEINFKTSPKTTRLEDDEIASFTNNGRVQ